MKKIICLSLVALAAGCADRPASKDSLAWANDCDKHFSYDSREKNICENRLKHHENIKAHAGEVVVNPENAVNDSEYQVHKSRD